MIVLGSSLGQHFADNPKYLFLYLEEHNPNFEYYWITKNKSLYLKINSDRFLYLYSFKGLWILLRAKYLVLSHQINDVFPPLHGGKKIIQLWHGTPLKRLGHDRDALLNSRTKNLLKKVFYTFFPHLYYMKADYIIVAADNQKKIFSSAFRRPENKIFVLGQPRNDILFKKEKISAVYTDKMDFLHNLSSYDKVISWLPTHRHGSSKNIINLLFGYSFNPEEVNRQLKANNSILIIKPHFIEMNVLKDRLKSFSHIHIYDEADPYPLLAFTDILVTDYSSIFFDFSMTKKPIILAPFDYDEYLNNFKDFYYDYNSLLKDYPKVYNWKELMNAIFDEKRMIETQNFLAEFNKFEEGSCKRVKEFLENLVANSL
ncbi:CDP-glycerol glycerophosphotransferase (TagB/SpsB family) [Anoxybacillus calidus]|uniref:CDP-glycerol glycerophosphotransferase (TagB/SpsB family) n=1 Tax=[Anoxybacillus] calidus TaxID=575178 RepID=A0A7W0BWN3_9BACL|nr:CDP-glycerol glycerophosphotransferase (TagB/SpsB family) [Anoxybacillus calidus]